MSDVDVGADSPPYTTHTHTRPRDHRDCARLCAHLSNLAMLKKIESNSRSSPLCALAARAAPALRSGAVRGPSRGGTALDTSKNTSLSRSN